MPRAPSVIPNIPQQPIGARGYSAPEVTPQRDFTGQQLAQQGQALQRFGESIGTYANELRLQTAKATADEHATFLHEQFRAGESEFGQKLGPDAVKGFAEYEKQARKRIADEVAKISDPDAKRMVYEQGQRRLQRSLDWATKHRDEQLASWRSSTTKAGRDEAAADYYSAGLRGDQQGAQEARERAIANAQEYARLQGFDETQTKRELETTTNIMHAGMVDGLVERGKGIEAFGYLEQHKDEMSPALYENRLKRAKAAAIEEGARKIDADPNLPTFDSRMEAVDKLVTGDPAKVMSAEDEQSLRRHLMQFEEQRQTQRAIQGQEARKEAEQFLAQNPHLTVAEMPPDLLERVRNFGVQVKRAVSNPDFKAAMRTEEGMRRLRMMSPERREFELQNNLTPSEAADAEKLIIGDQNGYTISQLTRALAIESGVIPAQSARGEGGIDDQKLLAWERNTIAPLVDAARTKLARPLTVRDFEELIRPLQEDKVWRKSTTFGVDWAGEDEEMTVLKAQYKGDLPVDDPNTPGVDESLDVRNNDFYVNVGNEEVRLASIPWQVRRAIRAAWKARPGNENRFMSAREEAAQWVQEGKPGAAKQPESGDGFWQTLGQPWRPIDFGTIDLNK